MTMIVELPGLQDRLNQLYREERFEELLIGLEQVFLTLLHMPDLKGRALFEPISDRYLRLFAEQHFGQARRQARSNVILHLATEVYELGGHTRIFEDIVAALPEYQHTLILTDTLNNYASGRLQLGFLAQRFEALGARVIILKSPGRLDRLHELDRMIERIAPHTIFINAHHFDTVTYGVVGKSTAPRVHLLHHCDYEPALGSTRDDYEHCDVTYKCHNHCKEHGFTQPRMLPLSSKDLGVADIDWTAPLTGLTSGTHIKYLGRSVFTYAELLVALFRAGVATMYHVGALPQQMIDEIVGTLQASGEDPSKFQCLGTVPSLAQTMLEIRPHFYMPSHPRGGLKAAIEAGSVGLPIIQAQTAGEESLFSLPHEVGTIASFASLEEVEPILRLVSSEGAAWGQANRLHYTNEFSPTIFRERLLALVQPIADAASPLYASGG